MPEAKKVNTKKAAVVKEKQPPIGKKKVVKPTIPAKESKLSTKLLRQGLVPTLSNYAFGPAGSLVSALTPFNARQMMAAFLTGDSKFSLKDAPEGVQRELYNSINNANKNYKDKSKGEFRGTQYKDYSPEMHDAIQNLKGNVPTVLAGSLLSDDFNSATTFGRVSYKDNPETNSYDVYDNYDFTTTNNKTSPYAKFRNAVGDLAKGTPLDPIDNKQSNYIGSFNKKEWDNSSNSIPNVSLPTLYNILNSEDKKIKKKENGGWLDKYQEGGTLPGSVGFTYARTQDAAPSNGPYAKKTKASAQDGKKISYNQWKKQNNLKETSDYNLKRAWELGYTPDKTGHLPTVDNQTGQFLKVKGHPTLKLELDWYNSPEGAEFKSKNTLDSTGKFFKYVPKLQNGQEMKFYQEGLDWKPKNISQWGGDYALDVDQSIQTIDNVFEVMSVPQKGTVRALTGKYQMPSKALGMQEDSWGAEAVDLFTDPLTYLGGSSLFKKGIGVASKVASKVGKGASKLSKAVDTFKKDFVQGYKGVPTREDGGIIKDDRGQWEYPGEITKINSNQITMQGVDYPVLGISDTGDTQMMQPGQDYTYEGESVTEYPMMKEGGSTSSKIICPNCGWGWKKSEAGNDPYVCHKCGTNNASKLQNSKKENGGWLSKYN